MKNQSRKNFRALRKFVMRDKEATEQEKNDTLSLLASAANMGAMIAVETAPEREAMARAEAYKDAGYTSQLENNEETYGRSTLETILRNIPAGGFHRMHNPNGSCDAELDAQSAAIVGATLHRGNVEEPLH